MFVRVRARVVHWRHIRINEFDVLYYVAASIFVTTQTSKRVQSLQPLLCRWCSQIWLPPQYLHVLRCRWCSQMLLPQQFLHAFRWRWCSQMDAPPHSLHLLRCRWCSQTLLPPHSLHWLLTRACLQMPLPPHSWHRLGCRWCGQKALLPHAWHEALIRLCWQMLLPSQSLHVLRRRWCSQMPAPPQALQLYLVRPCSHFLRSYARPTTFPTLALLLLVRTDFGDVAAAESIRVRSRILLPLQSLLELCGSHTGMLEPLRSRIRSGTEAMDSGHTWPPQQRATTTASEQD